MIYNNTRVIDLTLGELIDALSPILIEIVQTQVKESHQRRSEVYASSIQELAHILGVSRSTAFKMVHNNPSSVERLSPRRSRYNVSALIESGNRRYS